MKRKERHRRRERCRHLARYSRAIRERLILELKTARLAGGFTVQATLTCECYRDQLTAAKDEIQRMFGSGDMKNELADAIIYAAVDDNAALVAIIALEAQP